MTSTELSAEDRLFEQLHQQEYEKLEHELQDYLEKWRQFDMADHAILSKYSREVFLEKIRVFREGREDEQPSRVLSNKYMEQLRNEFWHIKTGTTFRRNPVKNFFHHPDYFPKLNSDHRRWMEDSATDYEYRPEFIDADVNDTITYLATYFAHEEFHAKVIGDRERWEPKEMFEDGLSAAQLAKKSSLFWNDNNSHKLAKADLVRLLAGLWNSGLILGPDGEKATQKTVMEEFGRLLNVDLSEYADPLSKAIKAQESKNTKVFRTVQESFMRYVREKEEKKYAD